MKPLLALALLLTSVLPARAQTPVVEYYHVDALGSVRAVTDQTGALVQRHDYAAFGEELPPQAVGDSKLRFTGKERDAETGLDYFGARYYGSGIGRFTTPDDDTVAAGGTVRALPYGSLFNPQSLNRYAYAHNSPLRFRDPTGHCVEDLCIGEGLLLVAAMKMSGDVVSYLESPGGQQQLRDIVNDTRTMITTAAEGVRSLFVESRRANDFTPSTKKAIDKDNAEKYGGINVCENCKSETVPGQKSEKGIRPPGNERQRDHIEPASKGGSSDRSNGQILCRDCNIGKGNKSVKERTPQ